MSILTLAVTGVGVHAGIGRHQYYLTLSVHGREGLGQARKWTLIGETLLLLSAVFTKTSIGVFLLRLFQPKRLSRWTVWIIVVLATANGVSSAILVLAQCRPAQKLWAPELPGKCWSHRVGTKVGYFNGGEVF